MSAVASIAARSAWYWNRLRAMDAAEVAGHLRRSCRRVGGERAARRLVISASDLETIPFPAVPDRGGPPERVRRAVTAGLETVLAGRWHPFLRLDLALDDPPRWQKDHLAGVDLETARVGFRIDPRQPPAGADAKLIWELSRWDPLIQLAQATWLLQRRDAGALCVGWLEDWVRANPPYRGWNWTSALESGLRLIQLAWIDALLEDAPLDEADGARLKHLVGELLPAHAWFTWNERSFGSSANNHLLGELAGLLVAAARWPAAPAFSAPLDLLHQAWEREVMAQFAADGGNREQALHYHLFAFELCLHAAAALGGAGRAIAPAVRERIALAASFYAAVQVESDPWDYGDSDDAFVTRLHAGDVGSRIEWRGWMRGEAVGGAIGYWLGPQPLEIPPREGSLTSADATLAAEWRVFPDSGIAVRREDGWTLRFDASPLGYLATAAHAHLDALHLSLWMDGVAIVIDPGTGTYYADPRLRELLASRVSHNGPCPLDLDWPRRLGAFLWSEHHDAPAVRRGADGAIEASLSTPAGVLHRGVRRRPEERAWEVADRAEAGQGFQVRWQLAPGASTERAGERAWMVERGGARVLIEAEGPWASTELGSATVSPSFRITAEAPCLILRSEAAAFAGALRTTFRRVP